MIMKSPLACSLAVRMAAPFPRLRGWVTTRTRGASSPASTPAVPSVLPSSTTTSSISQGNSTASTRPTTAASVDASLKTGMRIESFTSPRICEPGRQKESGRGLLLVKALSERWAVEVLPPASGCGLS